MRIQNTGSLTQLAAECTAKRIGSGLHFRKEDEGIKWSITTVKDTAIRVWAAEAF